MKKVYIVTSVETTIGYSFLNQRRPEVFFTKKEAENYIKKNIQELSEIFGRNYKLIYKSSNDIYQYEYRTRSNFEAIIEYSIWYNQL